jgi:Flp pilus assembly protein TadD
VQAYQRAVSLNPKNGEAYRGIGLAYQAQGMKAEAAAAFEKARELEGPVEPK